MTTKKKTNTKAKKPSKKAGAAVEENKVSTRKLTGRQEQFCREYIIDLNATQAAIRAGYSKVTSNRIGSKNMAKIGVQRRIKELMQESITRVRSHAELEMTADEVLLEVSRLARFRPEDFASIGEDGKFRYVIDESNIHKLVGISAIKVRECPPIKIVEMGIEIEREVVEIDFKSEKAKALEMLMKRHGLLIEKVEVEGLGDLVAELQKGRERVAKGCENV